MNAGLLEVSLQQSDLKTPSVNIRHCVWSKGDSKQLFHKTDCSYQEQINNCL